MEKLTNEKNTALFSLALAWGMLGIFAFIKNPFDFTISLIGAERRLMFLIVGVVMALAGALQQRLLAKSAGFKSKLYIILAYICNAAMIFAALTPGAQTLPVIIAHWATALLYMGGNPILVLVYAIKMIKNGSKRAGAVISVFAALFAADLVYTLWTLISQGIQMGKNGIMEIIPTFLTYTMFLLFNYTKLMKERKSSKLNPKAKLEV